MQKKKVAGVKMIENDGRDLKNNVHGHCAMSKPFALGLI